MNLKDTDTAREFSELVQDMLRETGRTVQSFAKDVGMSEKQIKSYLLKAKNQLPKSEEDFKKILHLLEKELHDLKEFRKDRECKIVSKKIEVTSYGEKAPAIGVLKGNLVMGRGKD